MARYKIITLVDITRTNPTRAETDSLKISQQANFNSLIQAIGLRSIIDWRVDPKMHTGKLPTPFDGKGNHWVWEFDTDRDMTFQKGDDPVGLLVEDLSGVPVIDRLNNSVDINPAVFATRGDNINTWVGELI